MVIILRLKRTSYIRNDEEIHHVIVFTARVQRLYQSTTNKNLRLYLVVLFTKLSNYIYNANHQGTHPGHGTIQQQLFFLNSNLEIIKH